MPFIGYNLKRVIIKISTTQKVRINQKTVQ